MSRYSVTRNQNGQGFRIDVVTGSGARHTMLGFDTEDAAARWVEADKRQERLLQADPILDAAD